MTLSQTTSSKHRNWAVVCGALRSPLETRIVINRLLELRSAGLLDGIVLSTWREGFRSDPEFMRQLQNRGVTVIETADLKEGGNGQTFRQLRLFDVGLRACPPDANVLKLRTDKCSNRISRFIPYLKTGPEPVSTDAAHLAVFSHRIVLQAASLSMPFNISDIAFYGAREDLIQLPHMDRFYDWSVYPGSANAEIRWFSKPFLQRFNLFRHFSETLNCRRLSALLISHAQQEHPKPLPEALNDVFACYLQVLSTNFRIASTTSAVGDISFRQIFGGQEHPSLSVIPMTLTQHVAVHHESFLEQVVRNGVTGGGAADALNAALRRASEPSTIQRWLDREEFAEIREFTGEDANEQDMARRYVRVSTSKFPGKATTDELLSLAGSISLEGDPAEIEAMASFLSTSSSDSPLTLTYYQLAQAFRTGEGSFNKSRKFYLFWLEHAAKERHVGACYELGKELEVEKDWKAAANWFREAALRNHPAATVSLIKLMKEHNLDSIQEELSEWMRRKKLIEAELGENAKDILS